MTRTETDHVDVESATRLSTVVRELSRYDLVLGVIPLALLTSAALASVSSVSLEVPLGLGSAVCLLAMVDALFVHPPNVGEGAERARSERSRRSGSN